MEFLVINKSLQPPRVSRVSASSVCELQDSLDKAGISDFSAYLNISDGAFSEISTRMDSLESRVTSLESEPRAPAANSSLVAVSGTASAPSTNSQRPSIAAARQAPVSSERKEGVVIFVGAVLILFFITVVSEWKYGFSFAEFGLRWFSYKEGTYPYAYDVYPLRFQYTTALFILLPLAVYGILRAMGILKRLFAFEANISKIVPPADYPQ